jgi:hypothetical protein
MAKRLVFNALKSAHMRCSTTIVLSVFDSRFAFDELLLSLFIFAILIPSRSNRGAVRLAELSIRPSGCFPYSTNGANTG